MFQWLQVLINITLFLHQVKQSNGFQQQQKQQKPQNHFYHSKSKLKKHPFIFVGQQQQQQHFNQNPLFATSETTTTTRNPKTSTSRLIEELISSSTTTISERELIGSGSYGTVHLLSLLQNTNDNDDETSSLQLIGKRPWRQDEFETKTITNENENDEELKSDPKERATRCNYYWHVEEHCFSKLPPHPQLPPYFGVRSTTSSNSKNKKNKKKDNNSWMLFGLVTNDNFSASSNNDDDNAESTITTGGKQPAPTVSDLMKLDCKHPQELKHLSKALGTSGYSETLDLILKSLFQVLIHVHDNGIVHRDIKPANLLVSNGTLLLLDFGSAADLDPTSTDGISFPGIKRRIGLENGNRVAVSPIYCAPEIFIDINYYPKSFDLFSSGLLFCQLLFSYLEERMDVGFHQQLEEVDYDLTLWLNNELDFKVRPEGLTNALEYLSERNGLWTLLEELLSKDPSKRPTAKQALQRLTNILEGKEQYNDNSFFTMVIESMDLCEIPTINRPLHFVATFDRSKPLGLILSEADDNNGGEDDEDQTEEERELWKQATKDASPGEVFVKGFVPGGQAEELDIFEIGDQLQGIGELPFVHGGFEKAVSMLQDQPRKAKNIRLHFDRLSVRRNDAISMVPSDEVEIHIADRGFWTSLGKRKAQEDAFILHEIHDTRDRSVLVAGVLDGHGGTAASTMVSETLPSLLSRELLMNTKISVGDALEKAWTNTCTQYRMQCVEEEECSAEYNPREGILMANTGSQDLVAGTTGTMFALNEMTGTLSVLNCGDSRSVVVEQSKVLFETKDHTPQVEEERLLKGIKDGLDYSPPQCKFSRWWLTVGDYEYAVARSLEGTFATSKGIISDADITTIQAKPGMILISASDGLWDVMDSNEVALDLYKMRQNEKMSASDASKALCSMALRKGSRDNISTVVVYL